MGAHIVSRACFVLVLLAAACQPLVSVSPASTPAAIASPVGLDCPIVDLRTPSGAQIDLSGSWTGGNTIHEVRQLNSCVWWMGLSNWPGDDPGSAWGIVFAGHLSSDFTLTGEWADIYTAEFTGLKQGVVTFDVDVVVEEGAEVIILRRNNTLEIEQQHDDYVADTLRRLGAAP